MCGKCPQCIVICFDWEALGKYSVVTVHWQMPTIQLTAANVYSASWYVLIGKPADKNLNGLGRSLSTIHCTALEWTAMHNAQCTMQYCTAVHCQRLQIHCTVYSLQWSVVGEVDSMGLKGAIERLLRRRNADSGQRIQAKWGEEEMTRSRRRKRRRRRRRNSSS